METQERQDKDRAKGLLILRMLGVDLKYATANSLEELRDIRRRVPSETAAQALGVAYDLVQVQAAKNYYTQ